MEGTARPWPDGPTFGSRLSEIGVITTMATCYNGGIRLKRHGRLKIRSI